MEAQTRNYDQSAIEGTNHTIYKFDHNVMDSDAIEMNNTSINIRDISPEISLKFDNNYADMCINNGLEKKDSS